MDRRYRLPLRSGAQIHQKISDGPQRGGNMCFMRSRWVRIGFRRVLDVYRQGREEGDREASAGRRIAWPNRSVLQKLYGVPVGLMFFEGAPRLARSGVTVPMLQDGDPDRTVVEAYPGVLARSEIGTRSYKSDSRKAQSPQHLAHRRELLTTLSETGGEAAVRLQEIVAPEGIVRGSNRRRT